ncbi:MAG: GvpL/GvpF family gas vesicle protein [Desulfomonilaceae bacterium]
MTWLLYCVSNSGEFDGAQAVAGVGAQPVLFVDGFGLSAAVSIFDDSRASFDVNSMITYHKVVESLFERATIIPFRYKTLLKNQEEIQNTFRDKHSHFKKLLSTLDGTIELGIRLVKAKPVVDNKRSDNSLTKMFTGRNPGKAYLESRKAFYSTASWIEDQKKEFCQFCSKQFDGLFVQLKSEAALLPEVQNRKDLALISVYFLVRKNLSNEFRKKFQELKDLNLGKTLLSGPWPPYNFVV